MEPRGVYGRHARPRPRMQPLAPFVANLLRTTCPEDGHKGRKGRWARTTLYLASTDAAKTTGRALGGWRVPNQLVADSGPSAERLKARRIGAPDRVLPITLAASMDATHGRERGIGHLRLLWPSFAEASEGRPAFRSAADWCSREPARRSFSEGGTGTHSAERSSGMRKGCARGSTSVCTTGAGCPGYNKPIGLRLCQGCGRPISSRRISITPGKLISRKRLKSAPFLRPNAVR